MKNVDNVSVRPVRETDREMIERWFSVDPEGARWVSSYRDIKGWLRLLTRNRRGWMAQSNNKDIGFIDLEQNDQIGYFSYYVAPDFRGHGYGVKLLLAMEPLFKDMGVAVMEGYFEPDNEASRRALERAGFGLAAKIDQDGMIKAVKNLG